MPDTKDADPPAYDAKPVRLNISHTASDGTSDRRAFLYTPGTQNWTTFLGRMRTKFEDARIARLRYLDKHGVSCIIGDEEDLDLAVNGVDEQEMWALKIGEGL
ncbi:hypothetical protein BC937DRAFT_86248 [Endogone sp. FLAS-F59071]|nr:hypothetical protein BC937DRAFT_86248 [Endogone sp. FLAS-F59071]|eukprot:RUS20162.1 hypothetical protein BC937DRAFT_86248 [Endogone sp. FLAS-F59071]